MKIKGRYEISSDGSEQGIRRAVTGPRSWAARLIWVVILGTAVATVQAGPPELGGKRGIQTMNANLYIGAGTGRILALDPSDPSYVSNLVVAVTGVYYEILASQPTVRLAAVADEIVARQPDLVAVQEATLLRNQSPGDLVIGGSSPATNVVFDYLQILVDALAARGAHYAVAATSQEWDVEMPMLNLQTGTFDDVRQTDRDAILVRTDLPPGQLRVTNPLSGNFTNALQFPALGLSVWRGWCSVDVFVRGEKLRYICAHLEEETSPEVQMFQAVELIDGPANVCLPVILSGDFNADPLKRNGVETYEAFAAAGFDDAWGALNESHPAGGLTWGHDEFLADPTVPFIWRIDLVLYRGNGLLPTRSEVLDLGLDRASPPFWASDHGSLTADFRIGQLHAPKPAPHWPRFRSHVCR
ncbi:MAG: endonuclease/exonuclease/phosphatase family protein [Verrucomicrobiota bacterium]